MEINLQTVLISAIASIIGGIVVAIINPYLTHRLNLKYIEKEIFFKKKLKYFEKLGDGFEKETNDYVELIDRIKKTKDEKSIQKLIQKIKNIKKCKNTIFRITPFCFFDKKELYERVTEFCLIENEIEKIFLEYKECNKKRKELSNLLSKKRLQLIEKSQEIINTIKTELKI